MPHRHLKAGLTLRERFRDLQRQIPTVRQVQDFSLRQFADQSTRNITNSYPEDIQSFRFAMCGREGATGWSHKNLPSHLTKAFLHQIAVSRRASDLYLDIDVTNITSVSIDHLANSSDTIR